MLNLAANQIRKLSFLFALDFETDRLFKIKGYRKKNLDDGGKFPRRLDTLSGAVMEVSVVKGGQMYRLPYLEKLFSKTDNVMHLLYSLDKTSQWAAALVYFGT